MIKTLIKELWFILFKKKKKNMHKSAFSIYLADVIGSRVIGS